VQLLLLSAVFGIQCATRMRLIVRFYSIFPHYLKNGMIFEKENVTEYKMCVLIFSTTFVLRFLNLRRNEHNIKNVYWYSCKVPVTLVRF
jgi:hypothetical protein